MRSALDEPPSHPGGTVSRGADSVTECRQRLASLLGVDDPRRVVLTVNATHALNLAVLGLGLAEGAHVVTTVTEHNSVLRPLRRLEERHGVRVTCLGLDSAGAPDAEAFDRALAEGARLFALNHVSNVTGRINPVQALFARARAAGAVTLLDASQSLGHVPVRPVELGADLVAFTGHKGLRGPPGSSVEPASTVCH